VNWPDKTQGPSGPSGAGSKRKQGLAAPFQRLQKWLQEDIRPTMPDHIINFARFQDTGTTDCVERGGLLTKVNNRVVIEEIERRIDQSILELLAAVARGKDHNHRKRDQGVLELMAVITKGEEQGRWCLKDNQAQVGSRPTIDLNTMYKTKEKKVQPVHNSTVVPHKVEGRKDWRERAKVRHQPNKDQSWRQFGLLIRDQTAPFPRGLQVTKERFKEMKIAK
jgi:hypothetical protein